MNQHFDCDLSWKVRGGNVSSRPTPHYLSQGLAPVFRLSLNLQYSPRWPQTDSDPSALASWIPGLQVYTTMPDPKVWKFLLVSSYRWFKSSIFWNFLIPEFWLMCAQLCLSQPQDTLVNECVLHKTAQKIWPCSMCPFKPTVCPLLFSLSRCSEIFVKWMSEGRNGPPHITFRISFFRIICLFYWAQSSDGKEIWLSLRNLELFKGMRQEGQSSGIFWFLSTGVGETVSECFLA